MNKQIYFDSYTNALDYCFNNTSYYKINKNDNFHNQITFTKKPSLGNTNIITLDLIDDNYKLHIQVYRMSLDTFELNYYVAPYNNKIKIK
tara:strand:+ start:250 stop:519 length:270 start_codon:yes stop_codon:yes gene_type:complete